ncbi:fructose-1-phosphatase, partial [Salmonella enterica subsp. enterica serovar Heidelberg str. 607309-34]
TILFSVAVNATSNLVVNIISDASVAQLDRVLGYEPSGRRFESSRMHHILRTFSDEDTDKIVKSPLAPGRITLRQQRPEGRAVRRVILPD